MDLVVVNSNSNTFFTFKVSLLLNQNIEDILNIIITTTLHVRPFLEPFVVFL